MSTTDDEPLTHTWNRHKGLVLARGRLQMLLTPSETHTLMRVMNANLAIERRKYLEIAQAGEEQ